MTKEDAITKKRIAGHMVEVADFRSGGKRVQKVSYDDDVLGTITTSRGEPRVHYTIPQKGYCDYHTVGRGGKTKEKLIRDCRIDIVVATLGEAV